MKSLLILLLFASIASPTWAVDRSGRLGVGATNQLKNDLPSLSFKLQRSKAFAIGGVLGLSTDDNGGGHGAGVKFYRIIFDEPQLNFFFAGTGALIKQKFGANNENSGFQVDLTMGSEFSFNGLSSLGFSFEFGVSFNKLKDFVVETVGNHFVVSALHFYI